MQFKVEIKPKELAKELTYREIIDIMAAKLVDCSKKDLNYYLNTMKKSVYQRKIMLPVEEAFSKEMYEQNINIAAIIQMVENLDKEFSYNEIKISLSGLKYLIEIGYISSNGGSWITDGKYKGTNELAKLVNEHKNEHGYYFSKINQDLIDIVLEKIYNFKYEEI